MVEMVQLGSKSALKLSRVFYLMGNGKKSKQLG